MVAPLRPSGRPLLQEGAASGRAGWVDAAKGLAIVLVVLHHVVIPLDGQELLPPLLADLNYTLATSRMPLLYLVSGLFAGRALARSWRAVMRRRVAHFAWLYLVWCLVTVVVEGLLQQVRWGEVPGVLLRWTVAPGSSLWFIYGLALFSVLTKLLLRVPATLVVLLALVLAVVVESTAGLAGVGSAWQRFAELYVFFVAGARFGPAARRAAEGAPRWAWLLVLAVGAGWSACAAALDLHRFAGVTLLQSVVLVSAVLLVCARFDGSRPSRAASWLGARTLPVYLVHGLVIAVVLRQVAVVAWRPGEVAATLSLAPAVAMLIGASLGLSALATRTGAGWLFALPRRSAPAPRNPPDPPASPTRPSPRPTVMSRPGSFLGPRGTGCPEVTKGRA